MRKSIALLTALSTVALSLPLALAEESSSSSSLSSISSDSSGSSQSSSVMSGPCGHLTNTDKLTCLGDVRKMNKEPVRSVRQNTAAHARIAACSDKTGLNKTQCLRSMQIGNKVMKETKSMKMEGKPVNRLQRMMKRGY